MHLPEITALRLEKSHFKSSKRPEMVCAQSGAKRENVVYKSGVF